MEMIIEKLLGRDIAIFYTRGLIYNAGARPREFRGSHRLLIIGPSPHRPFISSSSTVIITRFRRAVGANHGQS